jgi:mercuric ion transport protein
MVDATKVSEQRGLLATGGLIGAILASSCCIAPLAFVTLGISGAWIGNLTALAPYQWLFIIATVGLLGAGFWTVYFKPKAACEEGSYCATPASDRVVKTVLWLGTVLVIAAVAVNVLTPLLL